ncbi:MAG: HD domain-containing protein [Candidatus Thorarchaeota archaeon]
MPFNKDILVPIRVIRDPVHGNISIYPLEEEIIASKPFQRLRFISQLSLCSFVYPGAVHNRFSHSIGTMHLAGEMYTHLVSNTPNEIFDPELFQIVRLTALLHDIGHGPFSHVFERAVIFFGKKIKNIQEFHHENMSVKIIDELLNNILPNNSRQLIISLLEKKSVPSEQFFLSQIISSEFDADRADFLLRDSYFSGVSYGKYELSRLLDTMFLVNHPGSNNEKIITFKDKGLMALENFLFARYNMYRGVYYHHTNLIGDAMVTRGLYELFKRDLYPLRAITDPKEFIKWNDTRIFGLFQEIIYNKSIYIKNSNPNISSISGLLFRNLWKRVSITKGDPDAIYKNISDHLSKLGHDIDFIIEKITVKKIPYTHLPYSSVKDSGAIYIYNIKENKVQELSEVMKIQVPENFIFSKLLLVHPDYQKIVQKLVNQ